MTLLHCWYVVCRYYALFGWATRDLALRWLRQRLRCLYAARVRCCYCNRVYPSVGGRRAFRAVAAVRRALAGRAAGDVWLPLPRMNDRRWARRGRWRRLGAAFNVNAWRSVADARAVRRTALRLCAGSPPSLFCLGKTRQLRALRAAAMMSTTSIRTCRHTAALHSLHFCQISALLSASSTRCLPRMTLACACYAPPQQFEVRLRRLQHDLFRCRRTRVVRRLFERLILARDMHLPLPPLAGYRGLAMFHLPPLCLWRLERHTR